MSEALHKSIDDLESLTDKRWAYDAKDDGWWEFICNHPQLIRYVPDTLAALKLSDMKAAFETVIKCFP